MSDKHHDLEHRVQVLEHTVNGLKNTVVENGRTINSQLNDNRLALLKLDKKLDRVLTVAVQTATDLNLHRQRDIHLEDKCHPAQKIDDHLRWHREKKDEVESVGEKRWKRAGILFAILFGLSGAILSVWTFISTRVLHGGTP